MCQMLAAGGMRVFHDAEMGYPSFETQLQFSHADDPTWFSAIDGGAVKWLEPLRALPAPVTPEIRVLWMHRNFGQQAKSAIKFLKAVTGHAIPASAVKGMRDSYERDEPAAIEAWKARGVVHVVRFEDVIESPEQTLEGISAFLSRDFDIAKMTAEVRPRSPDCLNGLLELALIADRDARQRQTGESA